ncbi:hypothetical protein HO133_004196 [Letharia lupina]|uniref:Methyltransferase domain-containing protein n=1 Tax=Letharia lupina TaxID=560253 RepID=A0A8H6KZE3_9LECA|nr:uncharacterized protein HO133_004196 [Letharia lupina]KAF6229859.1 hypothetical protein HO133_004196 [Letharia lupina]
MPVPEAQSSPQESSNNAAQALKPNFDGRGPDHWTAKAYSASASFVPFLTQEIVQWLDPQPHDIILDLGCGDGVLTAKIRSSCSRVAGFDASANLIKAAENTYGTNENLTWNVLDCRYLENCNSVKEAEYTKIFSNAALHWILRDAATRMSVFRGAYRALQPGGTFVFEMGGAGNIADVHTALLAALVHQGVGIEKAREACPWFFPSEKMMTGMLEEAGFRVEKMKLVYRPTELTAEKEGGLKGWLRLMGANFLDVLPTKDKKEAVVREVCDVLQTVLTHEADESMWLGYVRLKVVARK